LFGNAFVIVSINDRVVSIKGSSLAINAVVLETHFFEIFNIKLFGSI